MGHCYLTPTLIQESEIYMSFFTAQTKTILIDDENSITITKPSFGKRQDVLSLSTKFDMEKKAVDFDIAVQRREMLCAWVTGWSGPGFEGRPATHDNVLELPPELADKVLEEIDSFGGEVDDDTKNA